jgi:hypothetical protein
MLGFTILYCTGFNVVDKSYRQVLTVIKNSQLILKLEILDKFRPVTNQQFKQRKLQHFLICTSTGEMGVLMTLKHSQLCACKHLHFCCLRCSVFVAAE